MVDASYWVYLVHLPFTTWVPGLLSHLPWPAAVKVLAVLGLATPIWWLSYDLLARNTFIGKVLNGRRFPRGLPHRQMVAGAITAAAPATVTLGRD